MNLDDIKLLTIETTFDLLIGRLVDFSKVPDGEVRYKISNEEDKDFYERITIHKSVKLPTQKQFEEELELYKKELTKKEEARLAEIERVEKLKQRLAAITDIRGAFAGAGVKVSNPALKEREIIESNDVSLIKKLEQYNEKMKQVAAKEKVKAPRLAIGKAIRLMCNEFMDLVLGYNVERNLSAEQVTEMVITFGPILSLIQVFRPGEARVLVEEVKPDGILVTQEMKDDLLEVLDLERLNGQ